MIFQSQTPPIKTCSISSQKRRSTGLLRCAQHEVLKIAYLACRLLALAELAAILVVSEAKWTLEPTLCGRARAAFTRRAAVAIL